ncbi:MAG TPA: DoxX family protein [Candidatus Angelobacter sp.]|nr:DoxX family protein [Candidatus Angelobacter sp.]
MLVLIILVTAILVFRGLGFTGAPAFASWSADVRDGLAVMLLFTGSAHFGPMKEDFIRMMPPRFPWARTMVFFTGLCEIAGAIGLVIPATRLAAGIALILFFIAVLPANIYAARAGVTLRGRPATALWLRVPMQVLFIVLAWWSTR